MGVPELRAASRAFKNAGYPAIDHEEPIDHLNRMSGVILKLHKGNFSLALQAMEASIHNDWADEGYVHTIELLRGAARRKKLGVQRAKSTRAQKQNLEKANDIETCEPETADDETDVSEFTFPNHRMYKPFGVAATADGVDETGWYLAQIAQFPLLKAEEEVELQKDIEAGLYADHLIAERDFSKATLEELAHLSFLGLQAKEIFINSNLRLAVNVTKKQVHFIDGFRLIDFVGAANDGLIRAVEKFDYKKGYKFSTYATWWLKQSIAREAPDITHPFHLPVHVSEEMRKVQAYYNRQARLTAQDISEEDAARALSMTKERVRELRTLLKQPISFDQTVGEDTDTTFGDLYINKMQLDTAECATNNTQSGRIIEILHETLDSRSLQILMESYGLDGEDPKKLAEIGLSFGITPERVRQIKMKALATIRSKLFDEEM